MKVKEIITALLDCPENAEVGFEHCHIDYVGYEKGSREGMGFDYVEMGGGVRGYKKWYPLELWDRMFTEEFPDIIIAMKDGDGDTRYYTRESLPVGIGTAIKRGAVFYPIPYIEQNIKEDEEDDI